MNAVLFRNFYSFIASPVGAVAKYCDEYVCVSVCLSARISAEPHARFLPIFLRVAYGRGSVLFRRGDQIPRLGAILDIFFLIDNALHSIAFGNHTKTAEPIDMPFGPRNSVLSRGDDPRREGAILGKTSARQIYYWPRSGGVLPVLWITLCFFYNGPYNGIAVEFRYEVLILLKFTYLP